MADLISAGLARVRRTELANLPIDPNFEQLCARAGHLWRDRVFTPLLTLKLFVLQIAHANAAINHLRHLSGMAFVASSYCEARARLPLAAMQELLAKLVESSRQRLGPAIGGARLLVVDATSFSMPDTPKLRKRFGLPGRQKPGVGYPVCKLMAILDLASGLFARTLALPLFTHDMRGVVQLHPFLQSGDILVGDRAFCSVIHLAMLQARSIYCVFRLHQKRKASRLGIVQWKRPKQCPRWMDKASLRLLPRWTNVRIIRHVIEQKGCRTKVVFLATTLLDPDVWSDERLIDLYRRRWEIETCFGHIKTGMKMNVLKCKTVEGVMKELTIYLLVYNLVRLMMLRWAMDNQVDVRRVSLIDAYRRLAARAAGLPGVDRIIVNPLRPGRAAPRAVRRRPKKYTLLTMTRAQWKPRNNQRKRP